MLEWIYRFTVDRGKMNEFVQWVRDNEDNFREHTRPGWTYIGTWMTVGGFGKYSGESRWSLESYEALGSGWGDETSQRLLKEFLEITDNVANEATLLRSVTTVQAAPNI